MEKEFYIRNANIDDCMNVFNLSNEDEVRNNSINKEKITLEHHLKWFEEKLADKKYNIYIVTNKNDEFLGQVRFQIEETKSIISISISEPFRGKGIGQKILKKSSDIFLSEQYDHMEIRAYILKRNKLSANTFEKAQYKFLRDETINDEEYLIYVYKPEL